MAAIIGFESSLYRERVSVPGVPPYIQRAMVYGHVAFEDNAGNIFGFSPDPIPDSIDPLAVYAGRYMDQTSSIKFVSRYVVLERFEFDLSWYEEAFVYMRVNGNEMARYCMKAPLRGPPYNCISYLREVLEVGNLPQTNFVGELFGILRERSSQDK